MKGSSALSFEKVIDLACQFVDSLETPWQRDQSCSRKVIPFHMKVSAGSTAQSALLAA
jgi:hypothetical protein